MTKTKNNNLVANMLLGNKALFIVIILCGILSIISPVFLTSQNLLNVLKQVCTNVILSCGFTIVLGAGMIDLTVGSQMGFTAYFVCVLSANGVPTLVAILVGLVIGAVIGAINAFFITTFDLAPFIVTMAMQQVLRGLLYIISGMQPVTGLADSYVWLGQGNLIIPVCVWIMLIMVVLVWLVINRTKFGRYVLAIGGNEDAARVCGINTKLITYGVFIATAACACIAGVMSTARTASAQPTTGLDMEMNAIAAAVIGGSSMDGGKVNVMGSLVGGLLVGVVNNGLNLMGVDSNWQRVSKGILILLAVLLDAISTKVYANNAKKAKG